MILRWVVLRFEPAGGRMLLERAGFLSINSIASKLDRKALEAIARHIPVRWESDSHGEAL